MLATPSLSQLRAHLSALLSTTHDANREAEATEPVVARDDSEALAKTLEILSDPSGTTDLPPTIRSGVAASATELPRR